MTPLLVGMLMVADVAIPLIFTDKWSPMIDVFKVLCLLGLATVITSTAPWMLVSLKKQNEVFKFDACCFVLIPITVLIAIQFGMVAAASAHLASYLIVMSFLHARLFTLIDVSVNDYLRALAPALGTAVVIIITILLLNAALPTSVKDNDLLVLLMSIISSAVTTVAYLLVAHRAITTELLDLANRVRGVSTGTAIP